MGEVLTAYVLDASYEVVGNEPHVIIWAVAEDGRRVLLRDRRFRPYFYVVPEEGIDLATLAENIRRLSSPRSPIIDVSIVKRRYFGRPLDVLRVTTVIPEYVREYREAVKKLAGVRDVLEADIRFAMRYLIDHSITPCTWVEFRVKKLGRNPNYAVDDIYEVEEVIGRKDVFIPPKLRIFAFDIEVYNPRGTPNPRRDPVIIIGLATSPNDIKQLVAESKNDREIIRRFVELVRELDPDVIAGYNSNRFDWPYLTERAKILGLKLDLGRRKGSEPRTSVYGHISIAGRLNVDLYNFAEEIPEVKVKTLEEVAEFLGVMKKSERVLIPGHEIYKYWDDPEKRKLLLRYSRDDIIATLGVADKILPFAIQLSSITGLPLDQVGAASVGFRLEWYLMREAYKRGELIPNRIERPYEPYRGAVVLEPLRGVHENIAVLDFSAMYPSIMIKYNIGPDTIVKNPEECSKYGCYEAPEVGYKFRKQPPGFFKNVLELSLIHI